jgi:hypothetical protein
MNPFYVRAKADFIRDGNMPARFVGGRFYEVDCIRDDFCQVVTGDIGCGWNISELDEHFERIEGNFLEDMAFRPIFCSVAIFLGQALIKNYASMWNALDTAVFTVKAEAAIKKQFLYSRRAQPDTKLDGWRFDIIKDGEPQYAYGEVIGGSIKEGHQAPRLEGLSVSIEFKSDKSFVWTVVSKSESTFTLD